MLSQKIKDHPVMVTLALMATAYAAGWGSYFAVLSATKQTPILESRLASLTKIEADLQSCRTGGSCEQLIGRSLQSTAAGPKSGKDMFFYLDYLYSSKLYGRERAKHDWLEDWDERCKGLASSSLVSMGFRLNPVESDTATRGDYEGIHLGVQCRSGYDHALIYGTAGKDEFEKLRVLASALESRMKAQWVEFQ